MKFFEANELGGECAAALASYDAFVRGKVGADYSFPLRMRDWELWQVLRRLPGGETKVGAMLDTGAFNTYLGLWLAERSERVVVSDIYGARLRKGMLRALGVLPRKQNEAPFWTWRRTMKAAAPRLEIRPVDLTAMADADGTFDAIVSVSVIEHIPNVERALAEMYRCLKPGGRMLLTTDCDRDGKAYADGVRYFSPAELERLFAPYPVVSERRAPDFAERNWCYGRGRPVVTVFVEIQKPG
ncbi:class I SAM-dependent methyltransferase [Horticoccus luteus]|uniref:Class I SAM-dependent methyltransferase n=1 Tax=Horticoccus luteus TaxID=2862869 RepID=A0A8F9XFJ2_9BACT|nr:class I SAM-dependent methyltransferase [Horticoccus luteus]QYM78157.1 class I SAM-dependent methyltransferase [Horticoccus luteus]